MPNAKGSTITGRLKYVRAHHGEEGVARLMAAVSPEARAIIAGVLPASWVPFQVFVEVCLAIDSLWGKGDLATCVPVARYAAEVNLPLFYKLFYRVSSPNYIMAKSASLWRMNYDSGHLAIENVNGGMRLGIEDFETPHRTHCLSVLGWASRSVELSGGRNVHWDEVACRASGDSRCESRFFWT